MSVQGKSSSVKVSRGSQVFTCRGFGEARRKARQSGLWPSMVSYGTGTAVEAWVDRVWFCLDGEQRQGKSSRWQSRRVTSRHGSVGHLMAVVASPSGSFRAVPSRGMEWQSRLVGS